LHGGICKEGGAVLKSFNDRYFVLESSPTSSTLTYYLKKTGNDSDGTDFGPPYGLNERGQIDLKGGAFTRSMQYSTMASAYRKQKYLLDLKSCPEGEEWSQAFRAHIEYANQQESEGPTVAIPIPTDTERATGRSSVSTPTREQQQQQQQQSEGAGAALSSSDTVYIDDASCAYQYIYLYERWQPLVEWGNSYPGHLLPTDKGKYSNRSCTAYSQAMNKVVPPLPENWFPLTEFRPDFEVRAEGIHACMYAFVYFVIIFSSIV
jgi:hypothetical protein